MKHEDFCFRSFIFSFLSHRKHRTVKGGRGNTKEIFPSDAHLKAYTYPILRVKPLEISCSSVKFFSDRDEVLLVSEDFVLTEELGFCQCKLPRVRNMIALKTFIVRNSDRCFASRQLSRYLIHITIISLGAFMSYHVRLLPGYK